MWVNVLELFKLTKKKWLIIIKQEKYSLGISSNQQIKEQLCPSGPKIEMLFFIFTDKHAGM